MVLNSGRFKQGLIPWNKEKFNSPKYVIKRFNSLYKIKPNMCWEWIGSTRGGYSQFWFMGINILGHKFSYEFFNGHIPKGMTVDHICRNKLCVNPFHLDLVTRRENVLRGTNQIMKNATKTHCPNNHEYSGDNLKFTKMGRVCATCARFRRIKYRLKNHGREIIWF